MNYNIVGDQLPVVICNLANGESIISESGAMSWMSPNMEMDTISGSVGKALGRLFSGESIFLNRYTANGNGQIAFSSSFPGSIKAFNIEPGREIIVQKSGFLASEETVQLSTFFQKKFATGFFGGEGFILQKLSGHGTAFVEIDGYACEYNLAPGQSIIVSTGNLAAMDATCQMDIQTVKGAKNMFFGGEGFFNTVITGPGRIILQSMPRYVMARSLGVGSSN